MNQIISNFISSRTNLTALQLVLYFIIGCIMGEYLTLFQFSIVFILMVIINFITRTKAVADGMMFRQIMMDNKVDANEIVNKIKKEIEKNKDKMDLN